MHPCPLRRRRGHGVRQYRRRPTRPGGAGQASCSLWAHAPPGQDTYRRFPPTGEGRRSPPRDGWDHLRLPRPDPCLGTVAERQEHGPAGNGQKPLCPRGGRGERLVSGTPPLVPPRPASSPILHDAGPLRLLRRWRQHSAVTLVRQSGRADLAKVVVSARSTGLAPMGQLQRTPETPPAASRPDHPRLRRRERTSLVKNRMREIRTSGSVRDGGGDVPIYSAGNGTQRPQAGGEHGWFVQARQTAEKPELARIECRLKAGQKKPAIEPRQYLHRQKEPRPAADPAGLVGRAPRPDRSRRRDAWD